MVFKISESPSFGLAAGGAAQGSEILLEICPSSTSSTNKTSQTSYDSTCSPIDLLDIYVREGGYGDFRCSKALPCIAFVTQTLFVCKTL